MEKLLKELPDLINVRNIDELSQIIKNPDSFTIRMMSLKSKNAVIDAFVKFRENEEIKEAIAGLSNNDSIETLVEKLNESDVDELKQVAFFIEKRLQTVEGINLQEKSLLSVVWASVVYKYLTDKNNHLGIMKIDDIYEGLPVSIIQGMADGDFDGPEDLEIADLRKEVLSIFENTAVAEDVKGYFATSFIKNKIWSGVNTWCNFETLEPITLNQIPSVIDSKESLLNALATPSPEVYEQAIAYVSENYFAGEEGKFSVDAKDLKQYKSHLVVALLSASMIEEGKEAEYKNIALNLCAKIIASKEKIETSIDRSSIAIQLTKAYEETILQITEDAERVAYEIMRGNVIVDEFDDNGGEVEEEEVVLPPVPEVKKPLFKTGDRKAYINGYLKLFGSLIDAKLTYFEDQLKVLDGISRRKSYSADNEATVTALAEDFHVTGDLHSKEEIPANNARLGLNAGIVFEAVRGQHKTLSQIDKVFSKVKRRKSGNLEIDELDFDYKVLQKTYYIVENEHKEIIREFYELLASDPVLKQDQPTYRLLSNPLKIAQLQQRASGDKTVYPTVADMLDLIKGGKVVDAQLVADKLYINDDCSVNEKYERLYTVIMDKKSTLSEKQIALAEAVELGEITEEQKDVIEGYIQEVQEKLYKKRLPKLDGEQITLFDAIDDLMPTAKTDADDESENENQ